MGGGCLVYLLALFVVGAVFPNMFLEMLHEAVIRNMIGKGGVARGTRWWVGRHAASQPGYPLRCQFMRAHARCGTKAGMSLERPVRPRSLLLWLTICSLFPWSSFFPKHLFNICWHQLYMSMRTQRHMETDTESL